jgi:hypothetical protein
MRSVSLLGFFGLRFPGFGFVALVFFFGGRLVLFFLAGSISAGLLAGIVGYIPACAFELHGGSMQELLDRSAAFRALSERRIRKFPDLFKSVFALLALIFVERHSTDLRNLEFLLRF